MKWPRTLSVKSWEFVTRDIGISKNRYDIGVSRSAALSNTQIQQQDGNSAGKSENHRSIPTTDTKFEYQPLDLSARHIRLINIRKSHPAIYCTVHDVSLSSLPLYKALSYTWGEPFPCREILIDGKPFTIRENLYQFMLTLPSNDDTLYWIDQICINQSNVHERSHQVNFMDQIYSAAQEVVIWLGPAAHGSDKAMSALDESRTRWYRDLEDAYTEHETRILTALFQRNYWKRLWVLQEIMLARSIQVHCGEKTIPWSAIQSFFQITKLASLSRPGAPCFVPRIPYNIEADEAFSIAIEKDSVGEVSRLSHFLEAFSGWHCEDPRDKIYGLLGLVPEEFRISVDYHKPVREVYLEAVRKVMEDERLTSKDTHLDFAEALSANLQVTDVDVQEFVEGHYVQVQEKRTRELYNNF